MAHQKSLSEKKVLENQAGGKESKVEIHIDVVRDDRHSTSFWKWSGKIIITRNGHPFSSQDNNKPGENLAELIGRLFDDIRGKICNAYKDSNVDHDSICRFITEVQEKFVSEISA